MKKIVCLVFVLMLIFSSTSFAKEVTIEYDGWYYMFDSEEQQKDFGDMSDYEILAYLTWLYAPKTFYGKEVFFSECQIRDETNSLIEKNKHVISYDEELSLLFIYEYLGDGRTAEIVFFIF